MLISSNLTVDLKGTVSFVLRNGQILEGADSLSVLAGDMVVVAVSKTDESCSDYLKTIAKEFCATGAYTEEENENVDFLFIPIEHE
ncbi:hypothetical protein PSACC_00178 [Paramicrosporidium saccamoebae]|uniref:Uncharacterized protein n=1 Tax=Paramicrosporidium saccamoebae TaxID=1246581 RepID=A0A2H9TQI7_9FUNG|nr:hypothetical protein PSACC_00178 [Paramicrosporidium saccamoebae]